jgi:hypothetical protein
MTCCPFRVEMQIFSVFGLVVARGFVPERDDSGSSGVVSVKRSRAGLLRIVADPLSGVGGAVLYRGGRET